MRQTVLGTLILCIMPLAVVAGQSPAAWTRSAAIAAALEHSPRLAAARADTAVARARIATARNLPDPTLSASYTKSIPNYHVTAEMPLDAIWLRGLRIDAAEADQAAAQYREQYDRAAVALDADTSYTRALAALAHSRLSTRNAQDADSLLRIARIRQSAGDASELEVELATLAAGQQANAAAADSIGAVAALLSLQALVGVPTDQVAVTLVDSLDAPGDVAAPDATVAPLLTISSEAALKSAALTVRAEHRAAFGGPGIIFGFEEGDRTGAEPGILPTIGFAVPLPIFNRNRGPIAEAEAQRDRAAADVQLVQVESRVQISVARAQVLAATRRVARDRDLLHSADRVAALSLTAYREGAAPLANVLEAERTARDVRGQYVDDVAALLISAATLRLLTLTPAAAVP